MSAVRPGSPGGHGPDDAPPRYPEVPPDLPPRSRGVIGLLEENCTSCMLCARECPDWCIHIESHTEPGPGAGRGRTRPVLDRFAIDYSLCMYCGICVEVCPFDALFWSPEFEYAEHDVRELVHEQDRLREWTWTVPPPPALDPAGEPPKELTPGPPGREPGPRPAGRGAGPGAPARRGGVPASGGGAQPGDGAARPVEPSAAASARADARTAPGAGAGAGEGERRPGAPR